MSSLADYYCVMTREARSFSFSSPRSVLSDLMGSADTGGYDYHSGSGYTDHGGGYSSDYHDCCPLVVDSKTLLVLLALGAAATYLLQ